MMLTENLIAQMNTLKLSGMVEAMSEQISGPNHANLSFEDRLGLLLDREILTRENKRIKNLQKRAKLRQPAFIEDICFKSKRGLDKASVMSLSKCDFIRHHHNLLITGPTGSGKTYLSCAISNQACRLGFKVRYLLLPRFLEEMAMSHADGSYKKLMAQLYKEDLLILDDFGLTPINTTQRHDLFNLIESDKGKEIAERNRKLVCLPFADTEIRVRKNTFTKKKFIDIFDRYRFLSFLGKESFERWEIAFNL